MDNDHDHVFLSGTTANEVIVTDFSGTIVKTLTDVYGAAGMAIDGSTLYVAASTIGAIEKIDLATLTDEGVLARGLPGVRWLAVADGRLWTALGDQEAWDQLASVGFDGTVSEFGGLYYGAEVASSPATPDALYVAEDSLSPGSIYRFDVSNGTPVVMASARTTDSNIQQIAAVT